MNTSELLERKRVGGEATSQHGQRAQTPPLSEFEQACYEIVDDLPFTPESVKAYKKQKLHEERAKMTVWKPLRYAWVMKLWENSLVVIASMLAVLFPVSVFVLLAAVFSPPVEYGLTVLVLSVVVFGFISAAFIVAACAITHYHKVRVPYWELLPLERYRSPWFRTVPDEVCGFARSFQERLPDCSCSIEHLTYTGDPFLVIRLKNKWWHWRGRKHYVWVWGEPEFEG